MHKRSPLPYHNQQCRCLSLAWCRGDLKIEANHKQLHPPPRRAKWRTIAKKMKYVEEARGTTSLRELNLRRDAIEYLSFKNSNIDSTQSLQDAFLSLSAHQKVQVAWVEYFDKLAINGYSIYHLTITYNEPKRRALTAGEIKKLFENFYKKYLLKIIVGNNYSRNKAKLNRLPITAVFMDRHEKLANTVHVQKFGDRLHIHAMIAALPEVAINLEPYVGENTLKDKDSIDCGLIKTTYLKRASDRCPAYAAKDWGMREEYEIYGPPTIELH